MLDAFNNSFGNFRTNLVNSVPFFIPSLIQLVITIVTMPIFARNLSHVDFSIIGYFQSIQQFVTPILNLSFYIYFMKDYHKRSESENEHIQSSLVLFLIYFNLISIFVVGLLFFVYFKSIQVSFPFLPYSAYSLFIPYFMMLTQFLLIKKKMEKNGFHYLYINSSIIILGTMIGLFLVVQNQWGASGKMAGTLLSQFILGLIAFRILVKEYFIDFKIIKRALRFGFPLILAAVLEFPTQNIDRLFLERLHDMNSFGLYTIGLQVAGFLMLFGVALYHAFEPDFYRYIGQRKISHFIKSATFVFGSLLLVNLIFMFFSKKAISILTDNLYTNAYSYANLAIWGNYFLMLSYLIGAILIANDKVHQILYSRIILSILAVIIFDQLIGRWGFNGALYSKMIINSLQLIIYIVIVLYFYSRSQLGLFKKN